MSEQEDSQLWQEFKEMLNNSPYGVMKTFQAKDNELQELRAWKEKAMPYLKMVTREPMDSTTYKTLTELLGGDDEN